MMTRLTKEVRLLAMPAAMVGAATVLSLVWLAWGDPGPWPHQALVRIATAGFFLGIPLLAALPFGAEFQQRTMVLLLAQPVSRTRVWVEKCGVLVTVVLSLTALQYVALKSGPFAQQPLGREVMYVVVTVCSGMFWTMVAGSTIGGLAFAGAAVWLLEAGANVLIWQLTGEGLALFSNDPRMVAVRLTYAAVSVWLGWRWFVRYELRVHGEAIPAAAFGGLGLLRSRPTGMLANLLRKEVHLHQATVQMAGLFVLCWAVAAAYFAWAPDPPLAAIVLTVMLTTYVMISLVLAATISTSEETSLGVRAWHLTLPASARVQWTVKLAVAIVMVVVLTIGLPLLIATLSPSTVSLPGDVLQIPRNARFLMAVAAAFVICFWAASMFGHTVRAAVAAGVAIAGLLVVIPLVTVVGHRLRIGSDLLTAFMVRNQLPPDALHPLGLTSRRFETAVLLAILGISALLVFRQSLMAFRRVELTRHGIAKYAAQLAALVVVLTFIPTRYLSAVGDQYRSAPVRELTAALREISAPDLQAYAAVPRSVSVVELDATGELSADTRRWLEGSRIQQQLTNRDLTRRNVIYIVADVTFPNGRTFRMFYTVPRPPR